MAQITIKKCRTGCELRLSVLHHSELVNQFDAKMKKEYRLQWGTFPRDKKDIQMCSFRCNLFKLWIVLTLITMYPAVVARFASMLSSFIFQ